MFLVKFVECLTDGVELVDLSIYCSLVFVALGAGDGELVGKAVKLLFDEVEGVLDAGGIVGVWRGDSRT